MKVIQPKECLWMLYIHTSILICMDSDSPFKLNNSKCNYSYTKSENLKNTKPINKSINICSRQKKILLSAGR